MEHPAPFIENRSCPSLPPPPACRVCTKRGRDSLYQIPQQPIKTPACPPLPHYADC